jgi:hypothetical protein
MTIIRKAGTTDVSIVIRIIDSTDGTPETGVVAATGGLVLQYRRELAANVSLATIVDLAALTTAHTDKGLLHIGNGYYRLDLVDAACATGATGVLVHGVVTGMVVIGEYIQLVAYDAFDAVRLGLSAMPNAAADGAGGLPISDAGGLDLDARLDAAVSSRMATYTQPAGFLAATFPSGTVANTTNITAGTITTTTNLTTNNDKTGYALSATGSAALTEGYAADGATVTLNQGIYMILSILMEKSISSTTLTAKKLDGTTTAMTFTLDSATTPSSITRAS